ncbi:transposase [Streptomyces yokosukanensis]|uniref:transposase n=1 Tax=Streptomyces yokosukanensis TaxID=67386 RepID=UPI001FC9F909|nr:transposase [Streptomyces yokosukanensis]
MQFLLGLSDRQAAEAVRRRIDSKYAMAYELDDPGFHHSVLADFRERLAEATGPTASGTSHWRGSRRPDWCASAARSAPTPPTSWPRCAT